MKEDIRAKRRRLAVKYAKKIWNKYHANTLHREKSWYGECDLSIFPPIGVYRKTKVFCSDPFCCGNPRKQRGTITLTKQELVQQEKEESWEIE